MRMQRVLPPNRRVLSVPPGKWPQVSHRRRRDRHGLVPVLCAPLSVVGNLPALSLAWSCFSLRCLQKHWHPFLTSNNSPELLKGTSAFTKCFHRRCCLWGSWQPWAWPVFHRRGWVTCPRAVRAPAHTFCAPNLLAFFPRTCCLASQAWKPLPGPPGTLPPRSILVLPLHHSTFSRHLQSQHLGHFLPHPGWACRFLALSHWLWKTYKWERPLCFCLISPSTWSKRLIEKLRILVIAVGYVLVLVLVMIFELLI